MPRELYIDQPEHVVIRKYEETKLQDNQIRIQSEFSAIKHGTEFHLFSGKTPFATMRFDERLRMFIKCSSDEKVDSFFTHPGNITVGEIIETGQDVKNFRVGDRVYTYAPIRETVVADEEALNLLEAPMTKLDAVCTDPALFALAVVRDANVNVGDTIALSGLGAIGLFIVQMLKLSGCQELIVIDPIKKRRDLALELGATLALDPTQCDVGLEIRKYLKTGVDTAIDASGNYQALHTALKSVQMCGKIVTCGYYKGGGQALLLGQEWHHNRLTLISSMPVWENPLRDYPLWNITRLENTVKKLFLAQQLHSDKIVDPIVSFDEAADAYMNVYQNPNDSIKLGVRY